MFLSVFDIFKVGVAGLPKRVILRSVGDYGAWGPDRLRDVLDPLAADQRLSLVTWPGAPRPPR